MPTNYNGMGGNIPGTAAKVNIASSTNTTPVVVTTSTPHNAKVGDAVVVVQHGGNLGANGAWFASAVTSTTITLQGSVGTGVGTASGTLRCLAMGPEYPMPNDGEDVDAESVHPAFGALGDRTALIWAIMGWNHTIYDDGFLTNSGRTVHRSPYRPADAATIIVDTTMGDVVMLPSSVVSRIVQLRTSVNPPRSGERIRLVLPPGMSDGLRFTVQREDATVIAELYGYTVTVLGSDFNGSTWVECQVEGGVWRGGTHSGRVVTGAGW